MRNRTQLIFIHGAGGCKESWYYQTQFFKGSEAINLPGHPDGVLCPTINEYAVWLRNYINKKGYENVILAGHSLGGGIALRYALSFLENPRGIILVGSGARLRVHPDFLRILEKAVNDENLLEHFTAPIYSLIEPDLSIILKKRSIENKAIAYLNDMKACDKFDVIEELDSINIPLLAICGDQDILTPPAYSNFLAKRMSNAQVVIVSGGTHMVHAEKPVKINQAIKEFIDSL